MWHMRNEIKVMEYVKPGEYTNEWEDHTNTYYKDEESSHEKRHHNKLQKSNGIYPTESTQTKHCDGKIDCHHTTCCNTCYKYEESAPEETETNTWLKI